MPVSGFVSVCSRNAESYPNVRNCVVDPRVIDTWIHAFGQAVETAAHVSGLGGEPYACALFAVERAQTRQTGQTRDSNTANKARR